MIVDQSPEGLEVLRGSSTYTFDGNWKLQAENGADGYHVTAVHWNYAATTSRRKQADGKVDNVKAMDAGSWAKQGGGFYSFENGHMLLWTNWANPEDRPLYAKRAKWVEKFGQARADWMIAQLAQPVPVPERLPDGPVQLADPRAAADLRSTRPKSRSTASRPRARRAEARARRIRQYEDFFNATGMATPDDLEEFRSCQHGYDGTRRGVERHVPRRDALGQGPRRRRAD